MSGKAGSAKALLEAVASASGRTVDEVLAEAGYTVPTVTVGQYLTTVVNATEPGARKTYAPYWRLLVAEYGDVPLTGVATSMMSALAIKAKENAVRRSNSRNGVSAQENCVAALRRFFEVALLDKKVTENPAADVKKPGRLDTNRRAFTDKELADLYRVTANGGNDPVLDTLLLRFHLETGARRGGALELTRDGIDVERQCVHLHEKGGTDRWQPISKTLLDALLMHLDARGSGDPKEPVFRSKPTKGNTVGRPISRKRYTTLVDRWKRSLPWVGRYNVSIHWCRHHATSNIERIAGYAVARHFAGHTSGGETTTTYIKAMPYEVARAVELYTGEPHPLTNE